MSHQQIKLYAYSLDDNGHDSKVVSEKEFVELEKDPNFKPTCVIKVLVNYDAASGLSWKYESSYSLG